MDRLHRLVLAMAGLALVLIGIAGPAATARAQSAPDLRNIPPFVTLLVDSSGSMERTVGCVCSTVSCTECLPDCSVPEHTRWTTLLEAFTGTFDSYSCTEVNRNTYTGDYDHNYFVPHYEPGPSTQQNNGVLDVYLDRIRFALMTFDGIGGLTSQDTLITDTAWTGGGFENLSKTVDGMYSYGGSKVFTFFGCATDYRMDNGARNEDLDAGSYLPGNLISVGTDAEDHTIINAQIQQALIDLRPFGPTPIAGMLQDYEYYVTTHSDVAGDPYATCRPQYAVLITDGYPNADMRGAPYFCEADGYACPYDLPQDTAARLCNYDATGEACTGEIDGLFVIGFNISDADAVTTLDGIAAAGGTTSAYQATDRDSLMAALSAAFDATNSGATSRTIPTFVSAASVSSQSAQYQFTAGFKVSDPWNGLIERKRYQCCADSTCTAPGTMVVEQDISVGEGDSFHASLNSRTLARNLYTVVPTDGNEGAWLTNDVDADIPLARVPTGLGTPAEENLDLSILETSTGGGSVTANHMGTIDQNAADAVLDWVYARGSAPTNRLENRLGDIYHSSPVVVTAPTVDRTDEAFNLFRRIGDVATRPTVLYVGTNDGILHAFAVEDNDVGAFCGEIREKSTACNHTDYDSANLIEGGEELWGFVPPMLLPKLEDAANAHQWMVDGSPVVKDVYYARVLGDAPSASEYHTVLVNPLRNGGRGVFALDVTDPITERSGTAPGAHGFQPPKFLWQFTDPLMGETYGSPAIAQVLVNESGTLVARAVAIIPGGKGTALGGASPVFGGVKRPSDIVGVGSPRAQRSDYATTGRAVYIVDIATGRLLKKFDSTLLTAPMIGGVAAYPGDVGQVADRAFMTDADGVIWRLDLSDPDPASWSLIAFHDIFHDQSFTFSQPAYNPPVLSVDDNGDLVILQGTGDIDNLDGTQFNRVVSLTENLTFDSSTGEVTAIAGTLNWELDLDASEQVTGPLELFNGRVYFGSFKSITSGDVCDFGESRLWGVDYVADDGLGGPADGMESVAGTGVIDATFVGPFTNQLIMGVAVTQQPSCFVGDEVIDPYLGNRFQVTDQGGGGFQLVAQVGGDGALTVGSALAEITRSLPAPISHTSILGYAGSVD